MRKAHKDNSFRYFRFISILLLYCTFHQSIAIAQVSPYSYECVFEYDEPTKYEEYGDFAEILKIFEDEIALQEEVDESELMGKNVFFNWTKKLKRWFLKRTKKLLKKCLKLNNCSNPEECAYVAAKFKRKIDKVCNTGSIENILLDFDKGIPKENNVPSFEHFKDRVKFYHKHKHAKPTKFIAKGEVKNDLKNIPIGAVVGGVEVFCGSLISVLPFPGCLWLGRAMVLDGGSRITSSLIEQYEHDYQNDQKNKN